MTSETNNKQNEAVERFGENAKDYEYNDSFKKKDEAEKEAPKGDPALLQGLNNIADKIGKNQAAPAAPTPKKEEPKTNELQTIFEKHFKDEKGEINENLQNGLTAMMKLAETNAAKKYEPALAELANNQKASARATQEDKLLAQFPAYKNINPEYRAALTAAAAAELEIKGNPSKKDITDIGNLLGKHLGFTPDELAKRNTPPPILGGGTNSSDLAVNGEKDIMKGVIEAANAMNGVHIAQKGDNS